MPTNKSSVYNFQNNGFYFRLFAFRKMLNLIMKLLTNASNISIRGVLE